MLLDFLYYLLGDGSLSLSEQASSVFLGALSHQGQLTLYKSGPKIRKLGRWRGGEMPLRKTGLLFNYFLRPWKVFLGPSCILLRTVASHKPARTNVCFSDHLIFPAREIMVKITAAST